MAVVTDGFAEEPATISASGSPREQPTATQKHKANIHRIKGSKSDTNWTAPFRLMIAS
jgi:hypothetical protein